MAPISLLLMTLAVFLTGNEAMHAEILEPITESGEEVALIFIPGGYIRAEHYKKTAKAIQAASELRVWVALPDDSIFSRTGHYPVSKAVQAGVKALVNKGMTSENYVGVAHGLGGHDLLQYAKKSQLKALVLMGFSLTRGATLQDYPLPVLSLAAELDGVTSITRVATDFEKLKEAMLESFKALYTTPIILLEGANHAQFASGTMPKRITNKDIKPDVTEEEAHSMIGKHVSSFVTATFSSLPSLTDLAREELEVTFSKSFEKFQPFLDIKALDKSGNASQWAVMAQEYVAGELADQIQISNDLGQNPWFTFSKPSIETDDKKVLVKTTSLVHYGLLHSVGTYKYSARESPIEIDVKLKTKDAIKEALRVQDDGGLVAAPDTSLESERKTCKSLNEFALAVALNHTSPEARDRYISRGRPIIFEEDTAANMFWPMTPLSEWEDDAGFHVRAVAFSNDKWNPGMLYCKLISPYRAMEWVNVESLQE